MEMPSYLSSAVWKPLQFRFAKSITRLAGTQALRSGGPYLLRPLNGFENAPAGAGCRSVFCGKESLGHDAGLLRCVVASGGRGVEPPRPLRYPRVVFQGKSQPIGPRARELVAFEITAGVKTAVSRAFSYPQHGVITPIAPLPDLEK